MKLQRGQSRSSRERHERRARRKRLLEMSTCESVVVVAAAPLSHRSSLPRAGSSLSTTPKLTVASACPGLARRSLVTAPPRRGEVRRADDMLLRVFFPSASGGQKARESEREREEQRRQALSHFLDEKRKARVKRESNLSFPPAPPSSRHFFRVPLPVAGCAVPPSPRRPRRRPSAER